MALALYVAADDGGGGAGAAGEDPGGEDDEVRSAAGKPTLLAGLDGIEWELRA